MSANRVITYAPSMVKVKLFGINIDGFAADGVVDIERDEGATTFRKAMDGSRTGFSDRYGTYRVTLHLMQTSPSNTWIHQLYKVYQKIGVEFKMPLDIEDLSNNSGKPSFAGTDVFFENEPSTSYSNAGTVTSWSFIVHDGRYNRLGSLETYDVVEKIQMLMAVLDFSDSIGLPLEEMAQTTATMLDKVNLDIINMF